MTVIAFDGLAAALLRHALAERGLTPATAADAVMRAARSRTSAQASARGVRATITGMSTVGPAITPDRPYGSMTVRLEVGRGDGSKAFAMVGRLTRPRAGSPDLRLATEEIATGGEIRVRAGRDGLAVEIRRVLPETVKMGIAAMAGRPLRDLVDHPALADADMVTVTGAAAPRPNGTRRLDAGDRIAEGIDVIVDPGTTRVATTG